MNRCSINVGRGLACALLAFAISAYAHEGHEHGADHDEVTPLAAIAPVGVATTPQVEMVVAREVADVVIYVDDYASNAPIDGLKVQVQNGTQLLQASAAGDGIYRLPAGLIDVPHRDVPYTFLLQGRGLDLKLQSVVPPALSPQKVPDRPLRWNAVSVAIVGTLLVLAIGWRTLRQRRVRA